MRARRPWAGRGRAESPRKIMPCFVVAAGRRSLAATVRVASASTRKPRPLGLEDRVEFRARDGIRQRALDTVAFHVRADREHVRERALGDDEMLAAASPPSATTMVSRRRRKS